MTSDDTHQRTVDLLRKHAYFGAKEEQIILIKQEKVACLSGGWEKVAAGMGNGVCACLPCPPAQLAALALLAYLQATLPTWHWASRVL